MNHRLKELYNNLLRFLPFSFLTSIIGFVGLQILIKEGVQYHIIIGKICLIINSSITLGIIIFIYWYKFNKEKVG